MTDDRPAVPIWERLLPRLSSGAAVVTALCCIGLSAAVSLATALGATFLTRDSTLEPLLGITLLITVVASALTYRRHRNPLPLVLTFLAGALIYGVLYAGSGHASASSHDGAAATHGIGEHPMTSEHAAAHGTSDPHASSEHSMTEHPMTSDQHAAAAAQGSGGHGGGHGSGTSKAFVWLGLIVLIGAQVWDFVRLRAVRRDRPASA